MRRPDFSREQQAIRRQVLTGRRCTDCLRPFNSGQRKYIKAAPSAGLICADCYAAYTKGVMAV